MVRNIKCVVVGNSGVGKSSLLHRYATGSFPHNYQPPFRVDPVDVVVDEKEICIDLWDTHVNEDYDRLRLLAYGASDVFLICFSLIDRSSYDDVKQKWYPEVSNYCPGVPVVLVGTKLDLRDDKETVDGQQSQHETPITITEGIDLQCNINASKYVECSALTGRQVQTVFDEAIRSVLNQAKKNTRCTVI